MYGSVIYYHEDGNKKSKPINERAISYDDAVKLSRAGLLGVWGNKKSKEGEMVSSREMENFWKSVVARYNAFKKVSRANRKLLNYSISLKEAKKIFDKLFINENPNLSSRGLLSLQRLFKLLEGADFLYEQAESNPPVPGDYSDGLAYGWKEPDISKRFKVPEEIKTTLNKAMASRRTDEHIGALKMLASDVGVNLGDKDIERILKYARHAEGVRKKDERQYLKMGLGQAFSLYRAHKHGGVEPRGGFSDKVKREKIAILKGFDIKNKRKRRIAKNIDRDYHKIIRSGLSSREKKKQLAELRLKAKKYGVWLQDDISWLMHRDRKLAGEVAQPTSGEVEGVPVAGSRAPRPTEGKETWIKKFKIWLGWVPISKIAGVSDSYIDAFRDLHAVLERDFLQKTGKRLLGGIFEKDYVSAINKWLRMYFLGEEDKKLYDENGKRDSVLLPGALLILPLSLFLFPAVAHAVLFVAITLTAIAGIWYIINLINLPNSVLN